MGSGIWCDIEQRERGRRLVAGRWSDVETVGVVVGDRVRRAVVRGIWVWYTVREQTGSSSKERGSVPPPQCSEALLFQSALTSPTYGYTHAHAHAQTHTPLSLKLHYVFGELCVKSPVRVSDSALLQGV